MESSGAPRVTPPASRPFRVRWLVVAVVVCAAVPAVFLFTRPQRCALSEVTIEISPHPITVAFYHALHQGYFAAEGLQVQLTNHVTGRLALAALSEKGSDFATCAETPFVHAYSQGAPLTVLASIGQIGKSVCIIGRRDRGMTSHPISLAGRRLGVPRGTSVEYDVYSTCLLYGVPLDQLTIVDTAPESLQATLAEGSVDAVAMWEPFASRARAALGEEVLEVEIGDFARSMWLLVARSKPRDPQREQALLRALIRATADLVHEPERYLGPVAEATGFTLTELRRDVKQIRYRVSLSQPLLLSLEAQRRWLKLAGPEVFDGLSPQALLAVDPTAVDLVHPEVIP